MYLMQTQDAAFGVPCIEKHAITMIAYVCIVP